MAFFLFYQLSILQPQQMLSLLKKIFHLKCHVSNAARLTADILEVKITRTIFTNEIIAEPNVPGLISINRMPNSYKFLKLLFTQS